jgi:phage-related minor tail protein
MDDLLAKAMPAKDHTTKVIAAFGDLGKASGLSIAADVMDALAEDGPQISASEVRAAAKSLRRSAEGLKYRSQQTLDQYKED